MRNNSLILEMGLQLIRHLTGLVLALTAGCFPALAATGGSIAGTVADPSGAMMPEVIVMARNIDTGIVQRSATNEAGFYAFPALPSGECATAAWPTLIL